jgi:hypothetical protein
VDSGPLQHCTALYQAARQQQERLRELERLAGSLPEPQLDYLRWRVRHRVPDGTQVFTMAGGRP